MNRRTILVTGATSGIGEATAKALAAQGHTVLCHGRTPSKVEATVADLHASGGLAIPFVADLSDLLAVRRLGAEVTAAHPDLSVLLNNAGGWNPERHESAQGFELTFAVNHLAPFALTRALLPTLSANAGRVVTVSSALHKRGSIDFDDLHKTRGYSGMSAYNDSKLANALFAFELARRHPEITSNALHPGVVRTGLATGKSGFAAWVFKNIIQRFFGIEAEAGAETSVFVATDPSLDGVTGRYFSGSALEEPAAGALDEDVARRLWEISEELTGS